MSAERTHGYMVRWRVYVTAEWVYYGDGGIQNAEVHPLKIAVALATAQAKRPAVGEVELLRVRRVAGEDTVVPLVASAYAVRNTVTGKITPWEEYKTSSVELVLRVPDSPRWEIDEEGA